MTKSKNLVTLLVLATLLVVPQAADAKKKSKSHTQARVYSANSTCYAVVPDPKKDVGRMADGTFVRDRSIAMNSLPFGTKIKLVGKTTFFGRRVFYVRDRIGWGSELDFWHPSNSTCNNWGRRDVRYVVLKRGRTNRWGKR